MDQDIRCADDRCDYANCPCIDEKHSGSAQNSPALKLRLCCERAYRRAYYEANREKLNGQRQAWAERNPELMRSYSLKFQRTAGRLAKVFDWRMRRKFGISTAIYEEMLMVQCGVCAVCGEPETRARNDVESRRLSVHHDHISGAVIALVCYKCNSAMGLFQDRSDLMRRAADLNEGR